jgi:hypothetical protein
MAPLIERDEVKARFRPIMPLLNNAIDEARAATAYEVTCAVHPEVTRAAHLRRFAGSKRWVMVADGLVARAAELPAGFHVHSTEEDHNAGKYVFGFPGGVFTIRRDPHQAENEGQYLQLSLDRVREDTPLAAGVDVFADLVVYVRVPAQSAPRLIVTHPTLDKAMVITLDEIEPDGIGDAVAPLRPDDSGPPPRGVRSARQPRTDESQHTSADDPS